MSPKVVKAKRGNKAPKAKKGGSTRKLIYTKISVEACEQPITLDRAKKLLGWEEEEDGSKFGEQYVHEVRQLFGRKIRCGNNPVNRPIYAGNVKALAQEILNGRWRINGEPIILGMTGLLLNGQHTLFALIYACELWEEDPDKYPVWEEEPVISKIVVCGIGEDDDVINTMDTCKPRSLQDVVFRSGFFQDLPHKPKLVCSRILTDAVGTMWMRLNIPVSTKYRTHAEALDFVSRHPKMVECVNHVYQENGKERKLEKIGVKLGALSGLMYLMSCSESDGDQYHAASSPNEELLNWDRWDKAQAYITYIAGEGSATYRKAFAGLNSKGLVTLAANWAVVVAGWLAFNEQGKVKEKDLELQVSSDEDGNFSLDDAPLIGGIDVGDIPHTDETNVKGADGRQADPSPSEIRKRAKAVKAKKGRDTATIPVPSKPRKAGESWQKDDVAWVREQDGEHYIGLLIEEPLEQDNGEWVVTVQAADGEWMVKVDDLSLEKPAEVKKQVTLPKRKFGTTAKPPKHKTLKQDGLRAGMFAWVVEADGEHWRGKIVEISGSAARLRVDQGFRGAGSLKVVATKDLQSDQPFRRSA